MIGVCDVTALPGMDASPRHVTGEPAAAPAAPLGALAILAVLLLTFVVGCTAPRDRSTATRETADSAASDPCPLVDQLYDGSQRLRVNDRGQPAEDARRDEQAGSAAVAFRLTTRYPDCFTDQQRSDARAQFEEITGHRHTGGRRGVLDDRLPARQRRPPA